MENCNPCLLELRGQEKVLSYSAGEMKWQVQISIKLLDPQLKMEGHNVSFLFFHNLFVLFFFIALITL